MFKTKSKDSRAMTSFCSTVDEDSYYRLLANTFLLKVSNTDSNYNSVKYVKLTTNTSDPGQWRRSGVFIVNFIVIPHLVQVFLLWSLRMYLFVVWNLLYFNRFYIWRFEVSSIFREDFHQVKYFHEVGCSEGLFKTMECKRHFNKISIMKLKLWINFLDN